MMREVQERQECAEAMDAMADMSTEDTTCRAYQAYALHRCLSLTFLDSTRLYYCAFPSSFCGDHFLDNVPFFLHLLHFSVFLIFLLLITC